MPVQVVPLLLATVWSCGPVALVPQKLCSLAWAGWVRGGVGDGEVGAGGL